MSSGEPTWASWLREIPGSGVSSCTALRDLPATAAPVLVVLLGAGEQVSQESPPDASLCIGTANRACL
jgi:hypothetical protein